MVSKYFAQFVTKQNKAFFAANTHKKSDKPAKIERKGQKKLQKAQKMMKKL